MTNSFYATIAARLKTRIQRSRHYSVNSLKALSATIHKSLQEKLDINARHI